MRAAVTSIDAWGPILVLYLMLGVSSAWGGQNPQVQRQGQETGAEDEEQDDGEPEAAPEEPEEEGEDEGPSWRDHLYWSDGLYLDSTWNNLRVKFAGDVQNDTAGFLNTESAEEAIGQLIENGVEWRRVRLYTDGTFGTHFHFRFRWDFTASNPPSLQDAYFGIRKLPIPTLEIIAGRFKAPLGLEGYTGSYDTTFMERSLTNAFLPQRNSGLLFYGDAPRHKMRWAIGVLQPETENISLTNSENIGLSGRFAGAFHPKGGKTLVHLGIDLWRRNVEDTVEFGFQPESNLAPNFVDTRDILSDHVNIAVIENAVQKGRLSFQGEFVPASVESDAQGISSSTRSTSWGVTFLPVRHAPTSRARVGSDDRTPSASCGTGQVERVLSR